jgi:S1-C subfamily serine protease
VLFPYPHPKSIGLILDPKEMATVERVEKGSLAEKAGLRAKDAIVQFGGQPPLSIADVQWVLHNVPAEGGDVRVGVNRDGKKQELTLKLPAGWRRLGEITWRASAWGLRRMSEGGLFLEEITPEERAKAGAPAEGMALRVKFMGQYNLHATAKNSGFQVGDILIEFDGRTDLRRDSDVLAYGVTEKKPGDRVNVLVLRGGKKVTLTLPMQE